jgi:hypothetical protein
LGTFKWEGGEEDGKNAYGGMVGENEQGIIRMGRGKGKEGS